MKILLDCAPEKIARYSQKYDYEFWQLRTPLTRNKIGQTPYALDNGCFSKFERKTWMRMLDDAHDKNPLFVCLPDIVGSARRTRELFDKFYGVTGGLPRALVLQDGIEGIDIPWDSITIDEIIAKVREQMLEGVMTESELWRYAIEKERARTIEAVLAAVRAVGVKHENVAHDAYISGRIQQHGKDLKAIKGVSDDLT